MLFRGQLNGFVTYLILNERSEWQIVKEVCKILPDIGVAIFSEAFIVEAIPAHDSPHVGMSPKRHNT